MIENKYPPRKLNYRIIFGFISLVLGLMIFLMGTDPDHFGLTGRVTDGSKEVGFTVFGLGVVCISGIVSLKALWKGAPQSFACDIGARLVATGYLVSFTSAIAHIVGIVQHPGLKLLFFGPLQMLGVAAGGGIILMGFLLMVPYQKARLIDRSISNT
jgi:hypothetical protein